MRKLVLFRHGETDLNREHLVQGVSDPSLNETGVAQARNLAYQLKEFGISRIVSSDLKRAFQTARIVADGCVCALATYPELREQDYGRVELQPISNVRKDYADICQIMDDIHHPMTNSVSFPDAESRMDVFLRAAGKLDAVMRTSLDDCIGVSTHSGVVLSLMSVRFNQMVHLQNGRALMLLHDRNSFVDYVLL